LLGGLLPGGGQELMKRNHALAVAARRLLCEALEIPDLLTYPSCQMSGFWAQGC